MRPTLTATLALTLAACSGAPPSGTDSGEATDAGGADAGQGTDAGSGTDAGQVTDAGQATDAGQRADAGPSSDAGRRISDGGRDLSTDAGLFYGASRCADAGFRLCEDFESGVLDPSLWSVTDPSAVVIGTADHARGTHALHITRVGNGGAYIKETRTFPAPNNTYYGRMFVKFIRLPAQPMPYAHFTVVAASGSVVAGEIRISGQFNGSASLFGVGTDNRTQPAGTGDWTTSDNDPAGMPRPVPLNQWICMEWLHQGSTNETRFYWDAVEHPSLHTTASVHGGNANPFILPQFDQVWVGWDEYQGSTETFEMWIDEVAIDPRRIGCVE